MKVSVIVPTYCPGEGLSRVIDSLDAQSMDQAEFESVFVDDGSPDDTRARLDELTTDRPNMRVVSIPNSGWPSRPRNLGMEIARGEYVVFLDHDDELHPRALEDAWSFAHQHGLDALTAKETKSNSPFFSWASFLTDVVPPAPRTSSLLLPMTPHKMYRRRYLLDHDIRFPEAGPMGRKVHLEDNHFNIDVYAHGARLGVLASCAFYHWVVGTGANNSDTFAVDPEVHWQHLAALFEHLDESAMSQADADLIRANKYSYRVLDLMLGPRGLKRDDAYYARTLELASAFVERWVPPRIDDQLEPVARARSELLHGGHLDLLKPLAQCDRLVTAEPLATEVRMVAGRLHVQCSARWTDASGEPLGVRWESGRLTRVLPDDVSTALSPEVLDWSGALARARGDLALNGRHTKVGWPVPGEHETHLVNLPGERVAVETRTSAILDPRTAAMGNPLELDRWRIACRSSFAGFYSHPYVTYRGPDIVGLVDGRVTVARASSHHHLLLDVKDDPRAVLRRSSPDVAAAGLRRNGALLRLVVPVAGVSTAGSSRLPVRFRLREMGGDRIVDGKGHLVGDDLGARLELELGPAQRLGRGRHRLLVDGPGEGWPKGQGWVTEIVVRVGRGGRFARVSVEQVPVSGRPRRKLWAG